MPLTVQRHSAIGRKTCARGFGMVIALAILITTSRCSAQSVSQITLEKIIDTWKQRQARVRSAEFSWNQPSSAIGSWNTYKSAWKPGNGASSPAPSNSLKLSEDRIRYETHRWYYREYMEYSGVSASKRMDGRSGKPDAFYPLCFHGSLYGDFLHALEQGLPMSAQQRDPRRFIRTINGPVRVDFFARGTGEYPQALVQKWTNSSDTSEGIIEDLYYRPLLLAYRPLFPSLGMVRAENCRLGSDISYIDGTDCVLIQETKSDGLVCSYWVDPVRDFVVRRYLVSVSGRTIAQFDAAYRHDEATGWTPANWTAMLFTPASAFAGHELLIEDATAYVSQCKVNEQISHQEFEVTDFPNGTFVEDKARGEHFIALGRGRKRIVTTSEAMSTNASYRSLVESREMRTVRHAVQYLLRAKWILGTSMAAFIAAIIAAIRQRSLQKIGRRRR